MTNNWTKIHQEFGKSWGEDLKKNWESNDFNYQQVENLISIGLIPREYDFAWWIINKQKLTLAHLNKDKIEELREQLKDEWKDISSDWDLEARVEVTQWIRKGFSQLEVKQWIEKGLTLNESDLAIYSIKQKGYSDPTTIDVEELRRDYEERNFIDAQEYLEQKFFKEGSIYCIWIWWNAKIASRNWNRTWRIFWSTLFNSLATRM